MLILPPQVVARLLPVRSTSANGPKPQKKCATGWNMRGTNALIARFTPVDVVVEAVAPVGLPEDVTVETFVVVFV